jgi:hypothetical protein
VASNKSASQTDATDERELSTEELEAQDAEQLPDREAMTILDLTPATAGLPGPAAGMTLPDTATQTDLPSPEPTDTYDPHQSASAVS